MQLLSHGPNRTAEDRCQLSAWWSGIDRPVQLFLPEGTARWSACDAAILRGNLAHADNLELLDRNEREEMRRAFREVDHHLRHSCLKPEALAPYAAATPAGLAARKNEIPAAFAKQIEGRIQSNREQKRPASAQEGKRWDDFSPSSSDSLHIVRSSGARGRHNLLFLLQ